MPSEPFAAKPYITGLPITTKLAPKLDAFTTSEPVLIPPSNIISFVFPIFFFEYFKTIFFLEILYGKYVYSYKQVISSFF